MTSPSDPAGSRARGGQNPGMFAPFVSALAGGDPAQIAAHCQPDARSYGPLAWPALGAIAIAERLAAVSARLDGLQVELRDAFTNAA